MYNLDYCFAYLEGIALCVHALVTEFVSYLMMTSLGALRDALVICPFLAFIFHFAVLPSIPEKTLNSCRTALAVTSHDSSGKPSNGGKPAVLLVPRTRPKTMTATCAPMKLNIQRPNAAPSKTNNGRTPRSLTLYRKGPATTTSRHPPLAC